MGISKKRAISMALGRLGFQARPTEVVAALAAVGVSVSKELIRAVRFELLRESARADRRRAEARVPMVLPLPRRFPRVPAARNR